MLRKEGKIDDGLIEKLLKWKHNSGFSIHNRARFSRDDAAAGSLWHSKSRDPFSAPKIKDKASAGTVIYKSKKSPRKDKGRRKNFQIFTAVDFIAFIAPHIPEKSFHPLCYYSWHLYRGQGEHEQIFAVSVMRFRHVRNRGVR